MIIPGVTTGPVFQSYNFAHLLILRISTENVHFNYNWNTLAAFAPSETAVVHLVHTINNGLLSGRLLLRNE